MKAQLLKIWMAIDPLYRAAIYGALFGAAVAGVIALCL